METSRRHISNFEQKEGHHVLKPVLQGIEGLASEEIFNMHDIARFSETEAKINEIIEPNREAKTIR